MKTPIVIASVLLATLACCKKSEPLIWQPADNPIMTRWASEIDPTAPWPEYPRPAMQRKEWKSLNGLWDYAITDKDNVSPEWQGKILVPYPVESALSGVKTKLSDSLALWYKTEFTIPAGWNKKELMLNFEASDWETTVWIDGNEAGKHCGGYDPFSFNITDLLAKTKKHIITVKVWDPTDTGRQPRGKQVSKPGGIWYTSSSGIWQSVWLEPVNHSSIKDIRITPDIDRSRIIVTVYDGSTCQGDESEISIAEVTVKEGSRIVATSKGEVCKEMILEIQNPVLWNPENPFLYDIEIKLYNNEKLCDEVSSYAGMRKISIGKADDGFTRILLNNSFLFQTGPLDQGFWPDGIYTPPTEKAMAFDLQMLKKMGFNMLRKHVKVESRRFYYLTDMMGMLVWQDMPSGDSYIWGEMADIDKSPQDSLQFVTELKRMIDSKFNNPSIIMWVIFNEGWGQYKTAEMTDLVSTYDTTRVVNSASGWTDRGTGDIMDIHHYPDPLAPEAESQRAIVLGEYGGLGLPVTGHTWETKNWGYRNMTDSLQLLDRYTEFYETVRKLVKEKGLSATVYTQTTDVETETNGLFTYDRAIDKMGTDNLYKIHVKKE